MYSSSSKSSSSQGSSNSNSNSKSDSSNPNPNGNISVDIKEIHLISRPLDFIKNLLTDDENKDESISEKVASYFQKKLDDWFDHQAILIKSSVQGDKTDTIQYHICEYSGENKGTYTFYKIDKLDEKMKWVCIVSDCEPKKCTVQEVDTYMKKIAKEKDYCIWNHSCRDVAQNTFYKFSSKKK